VFRVTSIELAYFAKPPLRSCNRCTLLTDDRPQPIGFLSRLREDWADRTGGIGTIGCLLWSNFNSLEAAIGIGIGIGGWWWRGRLEKTGLGKS
jgi:hypothetical protein